ncbi:virulence factor [Paenibacillus turpanensis]|uniref:virulence factor n=1 Tax=Paenibacillus turpanensis TaxID=2689078 RepID=UPI00140C1030|nr:virulence factor [Paenibacillus turpanensis]
MRLLSVEPTPSPNVMKLTVSESLPQGVQRNYTSEEADKAPAFIRRMLDIEGVKGVFHTADFIALERAGSGKWESILADASRLFENAEGAAELLKVTGEAGAFGEANVFVQMFRGIPMQIRVKAGGEEARIAMPERFVNAATEAGAASPNLIKERQLVEFGVRYGELKEIAEDVCKELEASYDEDRLRSMVQQILEKSVQAPEPPKPLSPEELRAKLDDADWKVRYAALERMKPEADDLPLLVKALRDEHYSVRRLAVVYIGGLKDADSGEVLKLLYEAMRDSSAAVRRTAGDALSDIGDPAATPEMAAALRDPSKIVRWRAARFLYEVGEDSALEALREAVSDPEFEVSLQARMAVERIERGESAAGTVWQQMARRDT